MIKITFCQESKLGYTTKVMQYQHLYSVFKKSKLIQVKKGQIIPSTSIYSIKNGFVLLTAKNNVEKVYLILKKRELFPVVQVFNTVSDKLNFKAHTNCQLLSISKTSFLKELGKNPKVAIDFIYYLVNYLDMYIDRVTNLEIEGARKKIAYRLLSFKDRFGGKTTEGILIDIPLTHKLIANSLNLSRETVSREFSELEQEDIIQISHKKIIIKNYKALVRLTSYN